MLTVKAIQNIIQNIKMPEEADSSTFYIPICKTNGDNIGRLVAIDQKLAESDELVANLMKWRRKFMKFFLTQFRPTKERTREWLRNTVIPDNTRILFLIQDETGNAIGNFGVCDICPETAELDNLIRGEKGGDQHLIHFAEISLLNWIFSTLSVERIFLRVFSNNYRTTKFHNSVGFSIICANKVVKKTMGEEVKYIVGESINPHQECLRLLKMQLCNFEFYKRYPQITGIYK